VLFSAAVDLDGFHPFNVRWGMIVRKNSQEERKKNNLEMQIKMMYSLRKLEKFFDT
jgi:hypothetical protein